MKLSEMMRMVEENGPAATDVFWLLLALVVLAALAVLIRNLHREYVTLRQAILRACAGQPLTGLKIELQGVQETDLAPMLSAETLQRLREEAAPVEAEATLRSPVGLLSGRADFDVRVRCERLNVQQAARLRVLYDPQGENDPDAVRIQAVEQLDRPQKEN